MHRIAKISRYIIERKLFVVKCVLNSRSVFVCEYYQAHIVAVKYCFFITSQVCSTCSSRVQLPFDK